MPIEVISTIKPKNNGTFPIAEACDIDVNGVRLDKKILNTVEKDKISLVFISEENRIYLYIDGKPVGDGIAFPSGGASGDVVGNISADNTIILSGNLADGTYTIKYEMEDGSIVDIGPLEKYTNVYYSVSFIPTNCTINNSATQVARGQSYSATITANSGYELKSVTVTMGGANVSVTNGVINIANVTGNIVITAVAEVSKPTNLLPNATFTADELASFTEAQKQQSNNGYVSGYRLSASKGTLSASSAHFTSGFIPVGVNDKVTIENITLDQSSGNVNNIVFYNSAKEFVFGLGGPSGGKVFGDGVTNNNGVYTFTPSSCGAGSKAVGYFRVSCASITTNSIITVAKA